jgi:hypothetical protein
MKSLLIGYKRRKSLPKPCHESKFDVTFLLLTIFQMVHRHAIGKVIVSAFQTIVPLVGLIEDLNQSLIVIPFK